MGGSCGRHKDAARSVVVGVPGVMLRLIVLEMERQGAPLRVVIPRWQGMQDCGSGCGVRGRRGVFWSQLGWGRL